MIHTVTVGLPPAEILTRAKQFFAERVPHDWFDDLRAEAPVYRHPEPHGPGFWVVTKHADIAEVSHDWEHNSSDAKHGGIDYRYPLSLAWLSTRLAA